MIQIFVDGSCRVNTSKRGGWAFCVVEDEKLIYEACGYEDACTNQRMELKSAIEGCGCLRSNTDSPAEIISDSAYLINGMTNWIYNWQNNGWINSAGERVKNKDQWEELIIFNTNHEDITWTWVKGHDGNKWNEYADRLATMMSSSTHPEELLAEIKQ